MRDLWAFDLDGTLYDDTLLHAQFMEILIQYVSNLLALSHEQVHEELHRIKEKWNTEFSVIALMWEYGIEFNHLVSMTYGALKLEGNVLRPDPVREQALSRIDGYKVVFTNSPSRFALHVLAYNGLLTCVMDLIGIRELGFVGKPHPGAYQNMEERFPLTGPSIFRMDSYTLCDDSLANLDVAKSRGWRTIWYRKPGVIETTSEHHIISSFEELEHVF